MGPTSQNDYVPSVIARYAVFGNMKIKCPAADKALIDIFVIPLTFSKTSQKNLAHVRLIHLYWTFAFSMVTCSLFSPFPALITTAETRISLISMVASTLSSQCLTREVIAFRSSANPFLISLLSLNFGFTFENALFKVSSVSLSKSWKHIFWINHQHRYINIRPSSSEADN